MKVEELRVGLCSSSRTGKTKLKQQSGLAAKIPGKNNPQFDNKDNDHTFLVKLASCAVRLVGVIVLAMGLTSCSTLIGRTKSVSENEPSETPQQIVEANTSTPTLEPTVTPTSTITTTPTQTPSPSVTPIVEGNIEVFTRDMEEGGVLDTLIQAQSIINSYKPEDGNFSDYIKEARENCKQPKLGVLLYELSQVENLNDMTFLKALENAISDFSIPNFVPWPNSMYDVLAESYYNIISNPTKFPFREIELTGTMISEKENIIAFLGDKSTHFELFIPGDITVNTETFDSSRMTGLNAYVVLEVVESSGEIYVLLVTVDDDGKVIFISMPESKSGDVLGNGWWILWKG